jgi:CRP-like cAMP-binding protein
MKTTDPAVIKRFPLFARLTPKEIDTLSVVLREESHNAGDLICLEGSSGHCCYFIVSGQVEVAKLLPNGERRALNVLKENEVFGQIALIDPGPRTASCFAKTSAKLLRLDRTDFDQLFTSGSHFAFKLQAAIAKVAAVQLREANRKLNLLLMQSKDQSGRADADEILKKIQESLELSDTGVKWIG